MMSPTFIVLASCIAFATLVVVLLLGLICNRLCRSKAQNNGYTAANCQVQILFVKPYPKCFYQVHFCNCSKKLYLSILFIISGYCHRPRQTATECKLSSIRGSIESKTRTTWISSKWHHLHSRCWPRSIRKSFSGRLWRWIDVHCIWVFKFYLNISWILLLPIKLMHFRQKLPT